MMDRTITILSKCETSRLIESSEINLSSSTELPGSIRLGEVPFVF